ncbi:MAG: DNA-directed RNA polymerase subunit alpha, partial [Bacteroidota bacterium]
MTPHDISVEKLSAFRAKISLTPFETGVGQTMGNTLRRILLSSMSGYAVTQVKIENVLHEYSTINGVQEDVIIILLNLKELSVDLEGREFADLILCKKGPGKILASDLAEQNSVKVLNPDLVIANLSPDGELKMQVTVQRGRG